MPLLGTELLLIPRVEVMAPVRNAELKLLMEM